MSYDTYTQDAERDRESVLLGVLPARETALLWIERYKQLAEHAAALEKALQDYANALHHYANEDHWDDVTVGPETNTAGYLSFEYDGGHEYPWQVARDALGRS